MKTTIAIISILCCLVVSLASSSSEEPFATQEMVNHINSVQSSWTASLAQGSVALKTRSEAKALAGTIKRDSELPRRTYSYSLVQNLPLNYDARVAFPQCETIKQIRDQSSCASDWAFGAVEAMSDRYCILQNKSITLSASNLLSCCYTCGYGCSGGFPEQAWRYWTNYGIVTEGCQPYPLPPCQPLLINGTYQEKCPPLQPTPPCNNSCANGLPYSMDIHRGQTVYSLAGEKDMLLEIYKNGPIQAVIDAYDDFWTYKSGVYKHVSGRHRGLLSVKVIGFGVEKGQKYWLAANSWDTFWGDKGFIKILRGVNECSIESIAYAGLPQS